MPTRTEGRTDGLTDDGRTDRGPFSFEGIGADGDSHAREREREREGMRGGKKKPESFEEKKLEGEGERRGEGERWMDGWRDHGTG